MARWSRATAFLRLPRLPRATVPSPRVGTRTPVLPRTRCGSFAAPPAAGATPSPRSRAAPAAPARTKSRRVRRGSSAIAALLPRGSRSGIPAVQVIVDPADHHLFPRLVAPVDLFPRVGVVGVAGRVVEVGHAAQ